jgi:hypothetical protein
MGRFMGGLTLALLLISAVVEATHLWRGRSFPTLVRWASGHFLAGVGLAVLSMAPLILGTYVSRWTGYTRLLFGVCLLLFFVGFALRAFLFFNQVQSRMRDGSGVDGALTALIAEPLASLCVVGLLWGVLRARC